MPGPKSRPVQTFGEGDSARKVSGKTAIDHASGKHARRLSNRHADPIREGGGKQFKK